MSPTIVKLLFVGAFVLASCSSTHLQRAPGSPLEVRYQSWTRGQSQVPAAAISTSVYRNLLAKSMYSQCRMVPHDSAFFDALVKRCGGFQAVFRSAARLFLERSASTNFLTPIRMGGNLRWLDPIGDSPCE